MNYSHGYIAGRIDAARLQQKQDAELEQLRVQLAGCSVAALGWTYKPAQRGDYGWSQAYQDVLELRQAHDDLQAGADLRWKADQRAIKMWQDATGRVNIWPDHADLVVWLMQALARVESVPAKRLSWFAPLVVSWRGLHWCRWYRRRRCWMGVRRWWQCKRCGRRWV